MKDHLSERIVGIKAALLAEAERPLPIGRSVNLSAPLDMKPETLCDCKPDRTQRIDITMPNGPLKHSSTLMPRRRRSKWERKNLQTAFIASNQSLKLICFASPLGAIGAHREGGGITDWMSKQEDSGAKADSASRRSGAITISMELESGVQPLAHAPTIPPPPKSEIRERKGSVTFSPDALNQLMIVPVDAVELRGARRLLEHALAGIPPEGEILLIVESGEPRALAAAIERAARERGHETRAYLIDPHEPEVSSFAKRLELQAAEACAALLIHGEFRLSPAILRAARSAPRRLSLDAPSEAVAKQLLRLDLDEIERLGLRLIEKVKHSPSFEISSGHAEQLFVEVDLNAAPIHYGGRVRDEVPLYLPAGQLIFRPRKLEGTIAADGGVWLEDGTAIGRSVMNRFVIAGGEIVDVEGPNAESILNTIEKNPRLRQVAGIGFGTNPGLISGVGAKVLELCLPGVHLLLGDLDAPRQRVAIIPRRPEVRTESEAWIVRGRFSRELIGGL